VRFRNRLREAGLHERLFNVAVAQLDQRGLLVRGGSAERNALDFALPLTAANLKWSLSLRPQ